MRWGNWELVVSEHPPVLRNTDWGDVSLQESCDYYWGLLGGVMDVWIDEKHELSRGMDYVKTTELLDALQAIYQHGLSKGRVMTHVEAAYSYAASKTI
jgi:hypothetical protein